VRVTEDTLVFKKGITKYEYARIDSLPPLHDPDSTDSPLYNFNTLWHTFNDLYCYFDVRDIDWNSRYEEYSMLVNQADNKLELFKLFENLLDEMNDNHVFIQVPEDLRSEYYFAKKTEAVSGESITSLAIKAQNSILKRYIDSSKTFNQSILHWGSIDNRILYIQLNGMDGFADYRIPADQSGMDYWNHYFEIADKSPFYMKDLLDGVNMIMDSIINVSKEFEEVILDIRFNRGGFDVVALNILGYFTDKEKTVFTKKTRLSDSYSDKQEIVLTPSESRLVRPTYLLTSHMTASAAEIMALSALKFENVTIVGSRTKGIFSDVLIKTLPNGWKYGLSNEIYESPEGINYENKGIPPDYEIDYSIDPRIYCKELIENEDLAIELILKRKMIM
jgi:hypothetical protein